MTMIYRPLNLVRWVIWCCFAVILVVAPLIFHEGASLSLLSQVGTLTIFALSFNMLLGQGGMLSFGHAVYSGLGAFFAIHALNMATAGAPIPVMLVPLIGGVAGMGFGILFGYVTTKKSGTTFSMITLGLVELVFAASLMFPEFFGGEGGISTNRVIGEPFMGITFGPQIQVYYLIAFWLFITTIGMYAFTQTPLGRLANAVRDNPERVEFIGYDTQWVRYMTLILSAFFAGISGGLSAINFEIVSAENVSALRSGAVLLFTFIGGIGFFFGPMIGAVIGVFLTVMLSDFTKAWQLYLGVFFILIVMYAPGGLASLLMMNVRLVVHRQFSRVAPLLGAICGAGLVIFAGAVILIEVLYHVTLDIGAGPMMTLFRVEIDTGSATAWLVGAALVVIGSIAFWKIKPPFCNVWDEVNTDIEVANRKAQT
ncbi:inner-membrane translocator [Oxalobacteraceae bacterium IMCC9480]|nr:inner-membrane translocator [Oxalobacteraceae bacterium IMCC9480]NDP60833.1 branched-chain amino acid ABC transporter permease [Oxalobacteraceae bacterium]